MAILEIKELKKSFDNTEVLKGINFSLEKGEVLAIIGSSGSGKTTLLRCLNFLELADSGLIEVNGKTVFDGSNPYYATDSAIRENCLHFGLVFQSFNLFPQYTVLGNLTLAPRLAAKSKNPDYRKRKTAIFEEIDKQALALLDRVGLLQKRTLIPVNCPAVSNSGLPLPGHLCITRKFFALTNQPVLWIRNLQKKYYELFEV